MAEGQPERWMTAFRFDLCQQRQQLEHRNGPKHRLREGLRVLHAAEVSA